MNFVQNILKIIVVFTILVGNSNCDFYTSISGLEELLDLESHYMEAMEKHLNQVEILHEQFKSLLNELDHEHTKENYNSTELLEDPINAFKIIRRVVADVPQLTKLTTDISNLRVYNDSTLLPNTHNLPTGDDLRGASLGFARLQKMYKLETDDMARGVLLGHKYSSAMSAFNCYILGVNLFEAGEHKLASEWLLEALTKVEELEAMLEDSENGEEMIKDKTEDEESAKVNELEKLSEAKEKDQEMTEDESEDKLVKELDDSTKCSEKDETYGDEDYFEDIFENIDMFKEDDIQDDMTVEENIDEDDFNNNLDNEYGIYPYVTAEQILEYLPSVLYHAGNRKAAALLNDKLLKLDPQNYYGLTNKQLFANGLIEERRKRVLDKPVETASEIERLYNQVCSGEVEQTPQEKRHLRCRYVTNNVPYYFLGPFKMEELSADPFVAFYHEVIYDNEIDQIISSVEDSIERSKVGGNADSRYDEIRVSKNSWLDFKEHRFLDPIAQRLEDMTGLTIETGEELQVANYGIAGHYGPHHDFHSGVIEDFQKGNRILTALFYINHVELGGATAFPILRLAVPPIKGSMVVWYNFHKSLQGDYRTLHAGCPVLQGSKWICNEWFSTKGQELKRPCGLEPDHEVSLPYKDWY
ncbi:prolyl 4-hydroxylase subunit alpha-2 [Musca vetustissima]|uniref:prolyl 4-hydroxylase subunit alpha-2 n=1 Tax=Musca vetustissima TaxID=27455 RepID=UPI002AB7EC68|nr:prolyl 4-hydroxylase subunit alpha-2 [Musca vetustissima]